MDTFRYVTPSLCSTLRSRIVHLRSLVRVLGVATVSVALVAGIQVVVPATVAALEPVTSGYPAGDFETPGLTPQGWTVSALSPNRAVVSSSRAISGVRSLLVDDTSSTAPVVVARPRFAVTPGTPYHGQGYAYSTKGVQSLTINFYDDSGDRLSSVTTQTTGAVMVWSRIETHATAPAAAATASIQISSTNAAVSQVWWDALAVINPVLPNGSFEDAPTSTAPVPGWSTYKSGGASIALSTAQARLGRTSIELVDTTSTGIAMVSSSLVPAFAGVKHEVRAWVRPTVGAFSLNVRWYDAARSLIGMERLPVSKPLNTWSLFYGHVTAPTNAQFLAVQLTTAVVGKSTGTWDALTVGPAPGAAVHAYTSTSSGEPLDAFSNSNTSGVKVIAGRVKVFTLISGYPAEFQLADLTTGNVEVRVPVTGMDVGWTLTEAGDGNIYFGGSGGHLWRYLPATKAVEDLGQATSTSTTVWDLETSSDGRIWGVSYPDSQLWSYDPSGGGFTRLGSVSASHDYARSLAVDGSYAYVGVGSVNPTIIRIDLSNPSNTVEIPLPTPVTSGNVTELEKLGRFLMVRTPAGVAFSGVSYGGERRLYDTQTGSWDVSANMNAQSPSEADSGGRFFYLSYKQLWAVDGATGDKTSVAPTTMVAGRERMVLKATIDGIAGEWLLAYDPYGIVRAFELSSFVERSFPVRFLPTKMRIKSVALGPGGSVYVGGFGGPSLSVVQPDTGSYDQYPSAPGGVDVIGEVEGSILHGNYQYLGTYTGGNIFRYNTKQPWVDGSNPKLIDSLATSYGQGRPIAWATAGARTFFGTIPKYGVLGGALGVIDDDTAVPTIVPDPVKEQSVISLAAAGNVVYGGTSRWGGLGATPTQASAKVFAYDASTQRKLWESTPLPGVEAFGAVSMGPGGSLWAASGPLLVELDPRNGALLRKVMIYPAPATTGAVLRNADLVYADGVFYLAAMDKIYVVDPATLRVTAAVPGGITTPRMALTQDRVYYAVGTELKSMNR